MASINVSGLNLNDRTFRAQKSKKPLKIKGLVLNYWLRGQDLNLRPSGYEPDELPDCSTPRLKLKFYHFLEVSVEVFLQIVHKNGVFLRGIENFEPSTRSNILQRVTRTFDLTKDDLCQLATLNFHNQKYCVPLTSRVKITLRKAAWHH